jgi:hypothetical protein
MADDGLSRLTEEEKLALVALVRRTIDADRYPLSPRIRELRGILAKLEGPRPAPATTEAERGCVAARAKIHPIPSRVSARRCHPFSQLLEAGGGRGRVGRDVER